MYLHLDVSRRAELDQKSPAGHTYAEYIRGGALTDRFYLVTGLSPRDFSPASEDPLIREIAEVLNTHPNPGVRTPVSSGLVEVELNKVELY